MKQPHRRRCGCKRADRKHQLTSTMLVEGHYKLLYYSGHANSGIDGLIRPYDIQADPEELVDLCPSGEEVAAELPGELKTKLEHVNQLYR